MNEGHRERAQSPNCSRMVRVTSVRVGDVLNSSPLTRHRAAMAGKLDPEPSSMSVFERVTTLIEVIGRGTCEQRGGWGESGVARRNGSGADLHVPSYEQVCAAGEREAGDTESAVFTHLLGAHLEHRLGLNHDRDRAALGDAVHGGLFIEDNHLKLRRAVQPGCSVFLTSFDSDCYRLCH